MIGGETNTGITPTVEIFDPATNTWTALPDMPQARRDGDLMISSLQDWNYIGGKDPGNNFSDGFVGSPSIWYSFYSLLPVPSTASLVHAFGWTVPGYCIKIEFGYLITDQSGGAINHGRYTAAFVFPLEELGLSGRWMEGTHELSWQTPSDINGGSYVVEQLGSQGDYVPISAPIAIDPGREHSFYLN